MKISMPEWNTEANQERAIFVCWILIWFIMIIPLFLVAVSILLIHHILDARYDRTGSIR